MSEPGRPEHDYRGRYVARRLDVGAILLRRWAGAWIDFIVLAGLFVASGFLMPRETLLVSLALSLLVAIAYFVIGEGVWGRSLGKLLTGTVVVDAEGNPPGLARALIRTLLRLIEVNPFLLGGVPAGLIVWLTRAHQRLGDLLAGTYVVPRRGLMDVDRRRPSLATFD